MADKLVADFVKGADALREAIRQGDSAAAQERYRRLYAVYTELANSDADGVNKQVAYEQLSALYGDVGAMRQNPEHAPREWVKDRDLLVIGVFLFAFIVVLVFKPSLVGLVTADVRTVSIGVGFNQDAEYEVEFPASPTALLLSGSVTGDGLAQVFVEQGADSVLVFDSRKHALRGSFTFKDVCGDACSVSGLGKRVKLRIHVDGASIFLSSISAPVDVSGNRLPVWDGFTTSFVVPRSAPLSVDLAEQFTDPDGDDLVFLSTSTSDLDVAVSGDVVTIDASRAEVGDHELVFLASDLSGVARQPVMVSVQDR